MEDSRKIHYFFLVLVFLFGCYGAYVNYKVLQEDTTPFIYDILNSYVTSIDHYRFLQQGDIIGFINHYITKYSRDYPALYMLSFGSAKMPQLCPIQFIFSSFYFQYIS